MRGVGEVRTRMKDISKIGRKGSKPTCRDCGYFKAQHGVVRCVKGYLPGSFLLNDILTDPPLIIKTAPECREFLDMRDGIRKRSQSNQQEVLCQ